MKFYEPAKYFSMTSHVVAVKIALANPAFLKKIPADLRPVFDQVVKETRDWERNRYTEKRKMDIECEDRSMADPKPETWIISIEKNIAGAFFAAVMLSILLQVVIRLLPKFFGDGAVISLPWTEELSRFVFVWLLMLGASVALYRQEHFSLTLVRDFLNTGGITQRLFNFARTCVGHITGGLGHVCVLASIIFAGRSGSATADAVGLGSIEIPAMEKEGYDKAFSLAIVLGASTIGPIIPPPVSSWSSTASRPASRSAPCSSRGSFPG